MDALIVPHKQYRIADGRIGPLRVGVPPRGSARIAIGSLVVGLLGGPLGCGNDSTGPAPLAPSAVFWAVQLNYHALNLALQAPYNTVQLHAAPVTATGAPFQNAGTVTYSSNDSSVHVDSLTGLVTALYATQGTVRTVIARMTAQGMTRADTAYVQVTPTAPTQPLGTFTIQPLPGDSAKVAMNNGSGIVYAYATTTAGDTLLSQDVADLIVAYTSSDLTVATIDPLAGYISTVRPGTLTFSASTWAYGVYRQDSLPFLIGYPVQAFVAVTEVVGSHGLVQVFEPSSLTVGHGAHVSFYNRFADTVDITFADTAAISGSSRDGDCNHLSLPVSGSAFRLVGDTSQADQNTCGAGQGSAYMKLLKGDGSYPFSSHALGTGGVITVRP